MPFWKCSCLGARTTLAIMLASHCVGTARADDADLQTLRSVVEQQQQVIEQLQRRIEVLERQESSSAAPEPGGRPAAEAPAPEAPNEMKAFWRNGLQLESEEKDFQLQIGGRIQFDTAWFDEDDEYKIIGGFFPEFGLGDEEDGVEFRRARISIGGRAYSNVNFKAEFDFAADSPGDDAGKFRDVYMGVQDMPYVGGVRVGQFKEPFSLEELGTDNAVTFMERGLPAVFAPSYNAGIAVQRTWLHDRINGAAGVFKTVDDWPSNNDSDEDQGYAFTARLTGLPWYREDGRRLLHAGFSYSHRNPDGMMRYRQRPEVNLANYYVDTGMFRAEAVDLYGIESALVLGSFSLQCDYILSETDTTFSGNRRFSGYYALASYLLTGENRLYKMSSATFDGVHPRHNFDPVHGGWGAWELALRYSGLDLNDGGIRGGALQDYTLGLNWYLNPNARVMINYVYSDVNHDLYDGDFQALLTRFQVNF